MITTLQGGRLLSIGGAARQGFGAAHCAVPVGAGIQGWVEQTWVDCSGHWTRYQAVGRAESAVGLPVGTW